MLGSLEKSLFKRELSLFRFISALMKVKEGAHVRIKVEISSWSSWKHQVLAVAPESDSVEEFRRRHASPTERGSVEVESLAQAHRRQSLHCVLYQFFVPR